MPWVGFGPTIPASERVKTVHASDRSATVTGKMQNYLVLKQRTVLDACLLLID
jgi:hypothetical protein